MNNELDEVKAAIKRTLVVQEPCTLEELVGAVWLDTKVGTKHALVATMRAVIDLIAAGEICEYDSSSYIDHPMDYAWLLSEERFV